MSAIGLRERKKLATRQALGQAAMRLGATRGLDQVRVEDIAAAAGVSVRTFNNYFSSKEEAIVSMALERGSRIGAALAARPAHEPLAEALGAVFVEQYLGSSEPDRKQVAQIQLAVSNPALQGEYLKAMARCERSLAEAVARRLGSDITRDLAPRVLAACAFASARAAILYWRESKKRIELGMLMRQAIVQAINGWTGESK